MKKNRKQVDNRFLKRTQEVLYQQDFKQADRVYNELTQNRSRS